MDIVKMDNQISKITEYDHHTLILFATIIFEDSGDYFYIKDDVDKIDDVSRMPQYIKEDWLNYNKKLLNISVINKQIKSLEIILEKRRPYDPKDEDTLAELKSIRRDLIIKGII